jgi:hypothetical protein
LILFLGDGLGSPIVGDDEVNAQLISSVDEAIKDLLGIGVVGAFYSQSLGEILRIPFSISRNCLTRRR